MVRKIVYAAVMSAAAAIGFIRIMVYGNYLTPEEMGYLSIALTVASYGALTQFGIFSGLSRELPVLVGNGRTEKVSFITGLAIKTVIGTQLAGLLLFTVIVLSVDWEDSEKPIAFILGALVSFFTTFWQVTQLRLRSELKVLSFAILQLVFSASVLGAGVWGVIFYGYRGALLPVFFIALIIFYLAGKYLLPPVDYKGYSINEVKYLIKIGLPLTASGVVANLQASMDRLFLIENGDLHFLGIYQMGILPMTMGIVLGSIFSQYVTPSLLHSYGSGEKVLNLFKKNAMISLSTVFIIICLFPLFKIIMEEVIRQWLPAYENSLEIMYIFYFGAAFAAGNYGVVLNILNKQVFSLYNQTTLVFLTFVGCTFISMRDLPPTWYAYLNVSMQITSFFALLGLSYFFAKKHQHKTEVIMNVR